MLKKIIFSLIYIVSAIFIIPSIITLCFSNRTDNILISKSETYDTPENNTENLSGSFPDEYSNNYHESIEVYNPEISEEDTETVRIINEVLENYIVGVVAAEMPASFDEEALKAQAVAARTYTYREAGGNLSQIDPSKFGQAYISIDEMKKRWGENYNEYYNKIKKAVNETAGEILIYDNKPILAAFHSTSCGITESSENVWSAELPYLKSVKSEDDKNAPNFISQTKIAKEKFKSEIKANGANITGDVANNIIIISRSDAGYVTKIKIGDKIFSGRDIRTFFNLRSTNFTVSFDDDNIIFITKGYGHGAGMSQYGANFMAQKGNNYKQILEHYYSGVEFMTIKG